MSDEKGNAAPKKREFTDVKPCVKSKAKKIKVPDLDVEQLKNDIRFMPRKQLEEIACACLDQATKSKEDGVLCVVAGLLETSEANTVHCVRCHDDYDPNFDGTCIMEEHDESTWTRTRGPGGWDAFFWGCCDTKEDDDDGPCWTGSHCTVFTDEHGGHWNDANQIRCLSKGECSSCNYNYAECLECCTCGGMTSEEE